MPACVHHTTPERVHHMYVSVTEIASFKRCRRQWDYGSFNGQALTPIIQPKPYLDLGSMVHKTLAYWTELPDLGTHADGAPITLQQVFMTIASQHRKGVVDQYTARVGHPPTSEEMEPLLDAIVLGSAMMANYQQHYAKPLPPHLKFCKPEQEILIPIPGTEHACTKCAEQFRRTPGYVYSFEALRSHEQQEWLAGMYPDCAECNGTGVAFHILKARLDALAQDRRDNLYVVERKTYENRPNLALLEITDQFIGYVWCAQQLDIGRVIGVSYDGMWKRATPPQRPKRLTLADLFTRTLIVPPQDMVLEYGEELARTVMDMANNPYIYKNRVWQGCWDCSFERLCRAQSSGDDVEYMIAKEYTRRTEDDASDIVQQVAAVPMLG